jgi:hypothetical protein
MEDNFPYHLFAIGIGRDLRQGSGLSAAGRYPLEYSVE